MKNFSAPFLLSILVAATGILAAPLAYPDASAAVAAKTPILIEKGPSDDLAVAKTPILVEKGPSDDLAVAKTPILLEKGPSDDLAVAIAPALIEKGLND